MLLSHSSRLYTVNTSRWFGRSISLGVNVAIIFDVDGGTITTGGFLIQLTGSNCNCSCNSVEVV